MKNDVISRTKPVKIKLKEKSVKVRMLEHELENQIAQAELKDAQTAMDRKRIEELDAIIANLES